MKSHRTSSIEIYPNFSTEDLRDAFALCDLFQSGKIQLTYTDLDRAIVGSAIPTHSPLTLEAGDALRANFFCERRELGIINLGKPGSILVDGKEFRLDSLDCLYVGRGSREIHFSSNQADAPAQFYLLSYPAHADHPTTHASLCEANCLQLGSKEQANERHLFQYIHENGIRSCQLVMGFTVLQPGSVWNTMPPHTHDRRSEVYCYFNVAEGHRIAHFMGEPQETRVLWLGEKDIALSPSWSVHCGAGTGPYSFVWGMGGENQRFDDMDGFPISELR